MAVKVDAARCVGCGGCIYYCPVGALEIADVKCIVKDNCTSCGDCIDACAWKALSMENSPPPLKDKDTLPDEKNSG